jgi:hypothetical protein
VLKSQKLGRKVDDLSGEEIYSAKVYPAIPYREPYSKANDKYDEGGSLAAAIIFWILLVGVISFVWFYR